MTSCWSLCLLLLGVYPCLTYPLSDRSDVTADDVTEIQPSVSRKLRRTGSYGAGDADLTLGQTDRRIALESALDRLFEDYLHGPSKPGRSSPSIVKANEEPNVYADEPEVSIDFRHDGMENGNSVVAKRYYYGRRCNISRLSRKAFVELIKTGKLCGRRVAAIRFGLTGR